jgi:hypothetical protein
LDANDTGNGPPKVSSIMSQIKGSNTVSESSKSKWEMPKRSSGTPDTLDIEPGGAPKVHADVQSTKLRQMLAGLKGQM